MDLVILSQEIVWATVNDGVKSSKNSRIKKSRKKNIFPTLFNMEIQSDFIKMWQDAPILLHLHLFFIIAKKLFQAALNYPKKFLIF